MAAEGLVVEAELPEGLPNVVVGLARGHDAEPGIRGGNRDPVKLVLPGVASGELEAGMEERPLHVEAEGRDEIDVDVVLERPAVELHRRDDGTHARGTDLGRGHLVGDIGHDLHPDPEAGDPREHEAVQPEVEDLLRAPREDGRHERVVERHLGGARQRGGLRHRVVAGQGEHAAVLAHARVVGVLEGVPRPVDARGLAVPHPEHAVVLRAREEPGHLTTEDGRGAEVFVQAGREHHVMRVQELPLALERLVEAAEGRAAVAGDEGSGAQSAALVGTMLIEGQPHQRLDAGEEDAAFLQCVLGLQGEALRR